jgi:hypothetical protein
VPPIDGKAARDLGYWPIVSGEEAFRRTLVWLGEQQASGEGQRSDLTALSR